MKKIIHYCWFGDKPLSKLAQKCIKSWQKYLPDYKIIKWSEDNLDINECPFVKEAYACKKWAFVADYARTKGLYEMGGIYFDTDMEITKDISYLLKNKSFLGVEDTGKIACGVWLEQESHSFLASELLKKYQSFKSFDIKNMSNYSIPILITDILEKAGFKYHENEIQHLDHDIIIYPRDYFYPYSYNRENNVFTDNTCMIHYYDASWIPLRDKIELYMVRKIGRTKTIKIIRVCQKSKDYTRRALKKILFPVVLYRDYRRKQEQINDEYINRLDETLKTISNYKNSNYITFYNKNWLGVTSATIELFDNLVDCGELLRKKDIKKIADAIINSNIKQVIFSSITLGEKNLIISLKKGNKDIKIKTFWHGSHSQILDTYGWTRNIEIIQLQRMGYIDVAAICKESLKDFYEFNDIKTKFITNKVKLNKSFESTENEFIQVGIYAARCEDWRKNMFASMAAVSLIPNAIIDMVPLTEKAKEFANILNVKITGLNENLSRDKLIKRMSKNDVNLYVTFSECSPMLPLESFEANVPCITGNNNHYFKNGILHEYTVVNNEESPLAIKEKILSCLNNKDQVMKEYRKFRTINIKNSENDVNDFLEM